MKQNIEENRMYFIDNLRGIAILAVVIGHSIIIYSSNWNIYSTNVKAEYFDCLKSVINVFQMPLFFAISGFLFAGSMYKRNVKKVIEQKIKRLILPFLAGSFLWLLPIRLLIKYPGYKNINLFTIAISKILLGGGLRTYVVFTYTFFVLSLHECIGEFW